MGAETANMHVRYAQKEIRADLKRRNRRWLEDAAGAMADAMEKDWRRWARHAG
jgi:hypothetical protein